MEASAALCPTRNYCPGVDGAVDVDAADIAASCDANCTAAVEDSELRPGTKEFAEAVCKEVGF